MRIVIAKEACNRKMSLFKATFTLNSGRNWLGFICLEHCFIWLRDLGTKKIGDYIFEIWCLKKMGKI
jgi:hypothetical protein